jgi:aspartyl/asparaginyl beta-hydroxylase (cupin superfamily)
VFEEIINMFDSPVCRVRLAVLMPGFTIKPHVDYDPSYIVRYHIPIFTSEQVLFGGRIKDEVREYHMPADGGVYFFNSGYLHWVGNNSTEPRLHLIVDTNGQDDLQFQ